MKLYRKGLSNQIGWMRESSKSSSNLVREAFPYKMTKPLILDAELSGRGPRMASDGLCSRPSAISGNRALGATPPVPPPSPPYRLHTASSRFGLASPDSANWANWHHSSIRSEPAAIDASTSQLHHPTQPLLVGHHQDQYWKLDISITALTCH